METLGADIQHPASQPMDFADLRKIVRERFSNYQHWLLALNDVSEPFINKLVKPLYSDADGEDFSFFVGMWQGSLLGVAAMEKVPDDSQATGLGASQSRDWNNGSRVERTRCAGYGWTGQHGASDGTRLLSDERSWRRSDLCASPDP